MLAQQRSCRLLVTPQSSSDPLEKNGCKQPPPPRQLSPFWIPPPLGIFLALLGGGGGYGYFLELHIVVKTAMSSLSCKDLFWTACFPMRSHWLFAT